MKAKGTEAMATGRAIGQRYRLTLLLAAVLALSPAVAWALPGRFQETAPTRATPQVVAQGIARLPRGDLLWTVRRIDVSAGEGTAVEEFPAGFVLVDGGRIALQNEDGDVTALLDAGEAEVLPAGRSGALVSRGADSAGVFEIALVSQRQAEAGEVAGSAAGAPFTAPDGGAFDLELARGILAAGEEAVIPTARSGAPVLFLLTGGTAQLESGGQVVDLGAGQFALLAGEVLVRGTGEGPAVFVAAAIGEATGERADTAGTPEARAGRGDRQRARAQGGGGGGGGGQQAAAGGQRAPREGRGGRGGGGGGGGRQGQPGAGGAPGGGTAEQPQIPGGTPAAETPIPVPATPDTTTPDTGAPTDGTPAPEATEISDLPEETTETIIETPAEDEPSEEVEEFPTSTTEPAAEAPVDAETPVTEEPPAAEEPIAEDIAPPAEEPAAEAPVEEAPVEEAPIEEAPAPVVEEPTVEETPAA